MGKFFNLIGTVLDRFQFGIGGPMLKRNSAAIEARNAADDQYAELRAALVSVFGDSVVLNAGSADTGDDWSLTITRPDTGMTEDIELVLPPGTPSPGQLLRVASSSEGVVALEYYTASEGASNMVLMDSTTLGFGDSSPVACLTKPAGSLVERVKVIIDAPFDGTPSVSIGVSGDTDKYMAATHVDLTAAAGTVFEVDYGLDEDVGSENIIATYSAGGATEGSARIQVIYGNPS